MNDNFHMHNASTMCFIRNPCFDRKDYFQHDFQSFCKSALIFVVRRRCPQKRLQRDHIKIKMVSLLMDVYSEHIVTFKKPTVPTHTQKSHLYSACDSAMMSFLFILNPCCIELWKKSLLEAEKRNPVCLLFVRSAAWWDEKHLNSHLNCISKWVGAVQSQTGFKAFKCL